MNGPFWCALCEHEEETINHLLYSCSMASSLWDSGAAIFRRIDYVRGQPHQTIKVWNKEAYKNPVIRKIWLMFRGTLMWVIWKEING